ncbi:FAD-dependent oxidoreductase [Sphingomonas sp. DBB INV C78]|uniref:NAD(P)/FAD-dependent oxidoreductase n=1 Tax=Sphingomonas sp. DBB INV C78 TaxID=3349434 RepID=UPI0036D26583
MDLTERLDLRGGRPCWRDAAHDKVKADPLPSTVDVAIVGAGIMGAMVAERLSRDGHRVALLDRRPPALGATAASTALVMWAVDVPLSMLSQRIGSDKAAQAWRRVHRAVCDLAELIEGQGIDCSWRARPELYLAGSLLDEAGLEAEGRIRRAAGLPSSFLASEMLARRFDLPERAGLLSENSFGVDPVALTLALLHRARNHGASLSFPIDVTRIAEEAGSVRLTTTDGTINARRLILATGYEAARWYLPAAFSLASSFAIATAPGTAPAWRENALIWEAASPYLYARATADGRIIVGGEDEDQFAPETRDAILSAKSGLLEAKGAALLGLDRLEADCAWAATFGGSPDGLPAIGRAHNAERIWLAYGFGGNGISFASLAASLIVEHFAGEATPGAVLFDPYRHV